MTTHDEPCRVGFLVSASQLTEVAAPRCLRRYPEGAGCDGGWADGSDLGSPDWRIWLGLRYHHSIVLCYHRGTD